jgi:DNA end-binding protein Ku
MDFVDPKEIDERYFETPYYLQPGKGADRSYALLRDAIRDSGRVGIAKIILRDAQHLAAVEAIDDALVLTMMRFSDELADLGEFKFPHKADVRPAELKMARQLIDNLASEWNPEKYTDEYTENLMRVIKAKMKGKTPKLVDERTTPKQAEVVDLMARLRASLEGKQGTGSSKKSAASKPRKASRGKRQVA